MKVKIYESNEENKPEDYDYSSLEVGDVVLFRSDYPSQGNRSMNRLINGPHGSHMFMILFINKEPRNYYADVMLISSAESLMDDSRDELKIPNNKIGMRFYKKDKPFFYLCLGKSGMVNLKYVEKKVGHASEEIVNEIKAARQGFTSSVTPEERRKYIQKLESLLRE